MAPATVELAKGRRTMAREIGPAAQEISDENIHEPDYAVETNHL